MGRHTRTEYVKIRLAMKIKRPKGERFDVEPPPKRYREKRIREK
jgi:hypothetical protein